VEALLAPHHRLAADGFDLPVDQTNICQRKKGYFFIRLLAMSLHKPNSFPITILPNFYFVNWEIATKNYSLRGAAGYSGG
jgi:hypothetical protein